MTESEPEQTKTKLQQRQERAGYKAAVRLQEQLNEEERQRIDKVHEEASFFNIEECEKTVPELTNGSSKRDAEVELDHEGSKKQKTNEASGSVQEQPEEETELSQEDLQKIMMVVLVESLC
ncbi:hypothetical protein Tco_1547722 [Tanacetum coccineum]